MTGEQILLVLLAIILSGAVGLIIGHWMCAPKKGIKYVGDKMTQEEYDAMGDPTKGPIGAFVKVCPECRRIDNIWAP